MIYRYMHQIYAQQRLPAKIGRFYISLIVSHRFSTITCLLAPVVRAGRGRAQAGRCQYRSATCTSNTAVECHSLVSAYSGIVSAS